MNKQVEPTMQEVRPGGTTIFEDIFGQKAGDDLVQALEGAEKFVKDRLDLEHKRRVDAEQARIREKQEAELARQLEASQAVQRKELAGLRESIMGVLDTDALDPETLLLIICALARVMPGQPYGSGMPDPKSLLKQFVAAIAAGKNE